MISVVVVVAVAVAVVAVCEIAGIRRRLDLQIKPVVGVRQTQRSCE